MLFIQMEILHKTEIELEVSVVLLEIFYVILL